MLVLSVYCPESRNPLQTIISGTSRGYGGQQGRLRAGLLHEPATLYHGRSRGIPPGQQTAARAGEPPLPNPPVLTGMHLIPSFSHMGIPRAPRSIPLNRHAMPFSSSFLTSRLHLPVCTAPNIHSPAPRSPSLLTRQPVSHWIAPLYCNRSLSPLSTFMHHSPNRMSSTCLLKFLFFLALSTSYYSWCPPRLLIMSQTVRPLTQLLTTTRRLAGGSRRGTN